MADAAAPATAPAGRARKPLWKSLYLQVIVAIVIGALLGHFQPAWGEAMKPLGDAESLAAAARAGLPVLARVRSTRAPAPARLAIEDGQCAVVFDAPEEGVSPGQACVLYDAAVESRVLGGGFIAGTRPA
jgi:hypothetical protein